MYYISRGTGPKKDDYKPIARPFVNRFSIKLPALVECTAAIAEIFVSEYFRSNFVDSTDPVPVAFMMISWTSDMDFKARS
jgi:hypothetical protein